MAPLLSDMNRLDQPTQTVAGGVDERLDRAVAITKQTGADFSARTLPVGVYLTIGGSGMKHIFLLTNRIALALSESLCHHLVKEAGVQAVDHSEQDLDRGFLSVA